MEKKFWTTVVTASLIVAMLLVCLFVPFGCGNGGKAHIEVTQVFEHENGEYYFNEEIDTPATIAVSTDSNTFKAEIENKVEPHNWQCRTAFVSLYTFDYNENESYEVSITPPEGYTYTIVEGELKFSGEKFKTKASKGQTIIIKLKKIK